MAHVWVHACSLPASPTDIARQTAASDAAEEGNIYLLDWFQSNHTSLAARVRRKVGGRKKAEPAQ